jgi:hypothetical protein
MNRREFLSAASTIAIAAAVAPVLPVLPGLLEKTAPIGTSGVLGSQGWQGVLGSHVWTGCYGLLAGCDDTVHQKYRVDVHPQVTPRCSDEWCCGRIPISSTHDGSWPRPCLNCGYGLVHCSRDSETSVFEFHCDSCDRWRFKAARVRLGMHDCLCIYDPATPYPACPHDCRGTQGAQGMVGSKMI